MKPNSEKKATVTAPLAAVKRGFANSLTSSIGSLARRSHATNAASRSATTAKPARLRALLQPWLGASMMVKIKRPIAAVESPKPGTSVRGALGSQAAGGQQQGGEHEVVGVDHPLQLAVGGAQLPHK